MDVQYTLICNLKKILDERNITPYRLAKDTGERIGTIYKMVDGKVDKARYPLALLASICGHLDITLDDLFTIIKVENDPEEEEK